MQKGWDGSGGGGWGGQAGAAWGRERRGRGWAVRTAVLSGGGGGFVQAVLNQMLLRTAVSQEPCPSTWTPWHQTRNAPKETVLLPSWLFSVTYRWKQYQNLNSCKCKEQHSKTKGLRPGERNVLPRDPATNLLGDSQQDSEPRLLIYKGMAITR